MKKILFFTLFQLILISTVLGCGCGREQFSQQAYDKYKLIFIGRLIEDEVYQREGYQGLAFEVIEVLKGQTTKVVKGKHTAGNCSLPFKKDQEWIIYSTPEYGSINDQYLCGLSTLLTDEFGGSVIGKRDYLPTNKWQQEITFLRARKTENDKIVKFQLLSLVPLFQATLLIIVFASSIIMSERITFYTPSILPASLSAATFGAPFLYFILLPEQAEFKIPLTIITLIAFLSLANIIYERWHKGQLTYIKSSVLCYSTYVIMMIMALPLALHAKYPPVYGESTFDNFTLLDIVQILSLGLPFSMVLAMVHSKLYTRWRGKRSI